MVQVFHSGRADVDKADAARATWRDRQLVSSCIQADCVAIRAADQKILLPVPLPELCVAGWHPENSRSAGN